MVVTILLGATFGAWTTVYQVAEASFSSEENLEQLAVVDDSQLDAEDIVIQYHVVQSGETVSQIAELHDLQPATILWSNNITTSSPIKPGQELIILPFDGLVYVTKSGDSLSKIADRFDVTVAAIIAADSSVTLEESLPVNITLYIRREFSPGAYLLARGGEDIGSEIEHAIEQSESEDDSEPEESESPKIESSEPEDEPETVATSSGWTHPAPGAILTQGAHGHNGTDFGAPVGTTVVAADSGVVTKAAAGHNGGFGTVIEIDHGDGTSSLYAHLSTMLVSKGDTVTAGQSIGYIGMTGRTTGPHLHFEVHGGSNPFTSCGYLSECSI